MRLVQVQRHSHFHANGKPDLITNNVRNWQAALIALRPSGFYLTNKFYMGHNLRRKPVLTSGGEGRECHIMPSGDFFAEARVQLTVELNQIDFLASNGVANEKIEPLPLGIAGENHWLHHLSRPTVVGFVQHAEVTIQVEFENEGSVVSLTQ